MTVPGQIWNITTQIGSYLKEDAVKSEWRSNVQLILYGRK